MMIMARTDARTVLGIDEAIERGFAYQEAGADILFIESPENEDEMKRIATSFKVPALANMVEGGRTPLLPNARLEEIGYSVVIYPTASTYVTTKAMVMLMETLKKDGTTQNYIGNMLPFVEFNKLIGLPEVRQTEAKYLPRI
jgi:2-methylisocitrate lyase-like PEP mutase family enzyme